MAAVRRGIDDRLLAVALGAAMLAVYVRTLLPGVGYSGDTAKWQFIGKVGGTPHPTGYPLYLMLDRAWIHAVPFGSLAWRLNLLSAVAGAATVALLFLLLRELEVRPTVAGATAATFGFTVTFWGQAVVAEVYTLHLLFLTAVTLCLTRWLGGRSDRWLVAGLGLYALSFGNHLGSVLALPGVAWLVAQDWRRALRIHNVVAVALLGMVGAGQYAYLIHMTDVGRYVEQPVHDVGDIVDVVTGGRFHGQMFAFGLDQIARDRLPLFGRLLRAELGVLLVPAAYGLVRGLRGRHRAVAVHLVLLGLLAAAYALDFDVLDVFVFFMPCYLVLAVFLGLGLEGVADRLTALADTIADRVTRRVTSRTTGRIVGRQHGGSGGPGDRGSGGDRGDRGDGGNGDTAGRPVTTNGSAPGRSSGLLPAWPGWRWVAGVTALGLIPLVTGLVNYQRASQRGTKADAARIERAIEAAGTGAVLITDNYGDSEYFWYYLLGEGLGRERRLRLANQLLPQHVVAWVDAGGGPLARVARPDTPIYTASLTQAFSLVAAGLRLTEVAPQVWRIER